jgi:ParB family chromosome partitioning protein
MPKAVAAKKSTKKAKRTRKKKLEAPPKSRGLPANRLAGTAPPPRVEELLATIEEDGGTVLGVYKDPLAGKWQILTGLPIDLVEPTPFQRDLSEAHVDRMAVAIDKLDRYLDPIIAVRSDVGAYWTPNGYHRLAALRRLGARSIVALMVPEAEVAHRILVLNTEKAHNLRERALEVIRLAEGLAELDDRPERGFAVEFEEPALLTLGACYQERGRFAGSAYHPVLKRVDNFLGARLSAALETRRERAGRVLALEEESPYLKAFVVARINPLRFRRGVKAGFDETIDKMLSAAQRFDAGKVRSDQLVRSGGPPATD